MTEDTVTVGGSIEEFAPFFENAGPLPVQLTFEQMALVLNSLKMAGEMMIFYGACQELLDKFTAGALSIRDEFTASAQTYLDKQ